MFEFLPEFLDVRRILIIAHIFGAILGAGGAFASDGAFLTSIKDGIIDRTEMRFIRLLSRYVWTGLILAILSGLGLFFLSPQEFLHSSKFLAKMTVVGAILANGIVFHVAHIPLLARLEGQVLKDSREFRARASRIMISGAISMTSWIAAVILGMLRSLPYDYAEIMATYGIVLGLAVIFAILLKKKLLHL